MNRMYDLDFEQKGDGTIRLRQNDCGEDSIIDAHPEQLKYIVRSVSGVDASTAAQVEDLERRLSILSADIEFIVGNDDLRRQIIDCEDGVELMTRLDALFDLSLEFDGGRLFPRSVQESQEARASDLSGQTVTKAPPAAGSAAKGECAKQLGLDV